MLSDNYIRTITKIDHANTAPYYAFMPDVSQTVIKIAQITPEREIRAFLKPSVIGCAYKMPNTSRVLSVIDETERDGVRWIAFDLMPSAARRYVKWYRESECAAVVAPIAEKAKAA